MFLFLGVKFLSIARHQALLLQLACIWFCILRTWWIFACLTSPHLLDIKCTAFPPAHSADRANSSAATRELPGMLSKGSVCSPWWMICPFLLVICHADLFCGASACGESTFSSQVLVGKIESLVSRIISFILSLHCVLTARKAQLTFW